jgi:outer membrane biosynthesis protein TonB
MQLAEDSMTRTTAGMWLRRVAVAAALLAVVVALTVMARKFISEPGPAKRHVAKISLLPDTPPPPPPPPREEQKKEPPKAEAKPVPLDQPKPQQAPPPQNEPIKMEGAAGDGPSAFAAGTVTQDYKGGPVNTGASGPSGSSAIDRANERLYASTARQLLRDEIERQLQPDAGQLTATFAVWVDPDGRIGRCQLQPSGDAPRDTQMQAALDGVARTLRLPPPPAIAQPMRFRLTVRAQG